MGSSYAVKDNYIILFDGVCNLCSGAVQFVIRRDTKNKFSFASLQSDIARQLLFEKGLTPSLETILVLKGDVVFEKSDAALEIARHLSGAWPLLYVCKLVPRFIRDGVYTWIANNRYRFFGRQESCMLPAPGLKSKFIG